MNGLALAAHWLGTGPVWRRFGVALFAGAASALALAPWHFVPVLLLSFTILVWLLDGVQPAPGWRSYRAAAAIGWWFGFGFFLSGLYWVGFALMVDAESFAHFIPAAVLLLPAGLAAFTAAAALLAHSGWRPGPARILLLGISWSVLEWLRGHIFTGFPWNLVGYAWSSDFAPWLAVLQSTSVIGIYGLGLITVILAALPALLADSDAPPRRSALILLAGAVVWAGLAGWGTWRLQQPDPGTVAGVRMRIVQPNVAQAAKWLPEQREAIFRHLLDLSSTPSREPPTHIIWPESATPFFLLQSGAALALLSPLVPATGALITGVPRLGATSGTGDAPVFNSVAVIAGDGTVAGIYDKAHLVPFGEYLPFPEVFATLGFKKLTVDLGSFAAGPGPQTLTVPGAPPFSPLICYEAIFPGRVSDAANRPGWLLNVTNDAWFGDTGGPRQHLAQARVRAVEEGLPLLRAANTGISSVFDAYGRTRAVLPLGVAGIVDTALPRALPATPYTTARDGIFLVFLIALAACCAFLRLKRAL